MDCNKEEAAKAKKLAEEKMMAGDFVGAHKLVTKAQRLYPNLANIMHMIAVCDVHSSADKKINGLENWYGILQVQPLADADAIKKQYRKLALLLHPDKNKFAGSEAAFKLIGEAYRWLSDRIKRSQYDVRYKSHSLIFSRPSNANLSRQHSAANSVVENIASAYTFWTCCKNCGYRYKYLKRYINTVMYCSACKKSYIACNTGDEGVPPSGSAAGKKEFQDQGMYNNNTSRQNASVGAESRSTAAEMDMNGTVKGELNKNNQEKQKKGSGNKKHKKDEGCIESGTGVGKPLKGETGNIPAEIPEGVELKPQPVVKQPETGTAKSGTGLPAQKKNQATKKRTKAVEEPSKSFEVDGSHVAGVKTDTDGHNKRRSSRKKPQVSCTQRGSDCDFVCPPAKKTKSDGEFGSASDKKQTAEDKKSHELADSGVSPASSHAYKGKSTESMNSVNEDILSAKNKESEGCDGNGKDAAVSSKIDKVENGYKANENATPDLPDPEFNVFEDERKTENFAVTQVWSIRDSRDDMPRKYVRVKKVLNAEFKLRITYLEPVEDNNNKCIPVACGKFKNGKTEDVEDRSIFSGQMHHSSYNKTVSIYPRKGEIWAIFRDWNEEWNTDPDKHKLPYKYDFVEVVNDFTNTLGVGVAYLGKLKGFVSLFHREPQCGVCQIQFTPEQILRFSHKVPAIKITGKEEKGIPANSHELDLAALPKDMFQVDAVDMEMDSEILNGKAVGSYPEAPTVDMEMDSKIPKGKADGSYPEAPKVDVVDMEMDSEIPKAKADGSYPEAPKVDVKAKPVHRKRRKSDDDNGVCSDIGKDKGGTSRNHDFSSGQVDEKNTSNKFRANGEATDVLKLRKSPRLAIPSQQSNEKEIAKKGNKMNITKKTDKGLMTDSGINKSPNGIHQPAESQEPESSKKQGRNCEPTSLLNGSTNESPETTPVPSSCRTPRRNAFDFKNQRSEDKFKVDEIWATYSSDNRMPTEYVKIKTIKTEPKFVLQVNHLELHTPSTEPMNRPVTCGEFKLKTGRAKILPQARFSHQVNPIHKDKKIIKIYPRKGEIWALYKSCDTTNEEYDIVQVVEEYSEGEIAKVVALTAKGTNSLYIIERKLGSDSGFIDIPKTEISRFSHQILGVEHKKRTTRLVEGGWWELDQAAIPRTTIVID